MKTKPLILLILDGVGLSKQKSHNALFLAKTPHLDRFFAVYPHSQLQASGEAVGLPAGVMGNSEVGHLTIGAGRVLLQSLSRISAFIREKSFTELPDIQRVGHLEGTLHIMGLVSDGRVHSSLDHLKALIRDIHQSFPHKKIALHLITDGRDTSPYSGQDYVLGLEKFVASFKGVVISSVAGRFYAMDRDQRWERTKEAYQNLISAKVHFDTAVAGIEHSYQKGVSDEFIVPFRINGGLGIQPGDQCVMFNFRADRVRQISEALAIKGFDVFQTLVQIESQNFLTFTELREDFGFPVLFPKMIPSHCFGEVLAERGLKQLRIAETEKYAHVTYFLNGGQEAPFVGEDRILVPSKRDVSTYDQKPEMSAYEITDRLLASMESQKYSVLIVNFANGDMVGHTANLEATIKAVEVMDACLGRIVANADDYNLFITADHGNCEEMVCSKTSKPLTQHTTNPVPLIWVSSSLPPSYRLSDGGLADIAPTLLQVLGCRIPEEMTGRCLLD